MGPTCQILSPLFVLSLCKWVPPVIPNLHLSQSPPWPHQPPSAAPLPDPGAARFSCSRHRLLRARRRTLWLFPAPPAPSSPPRAPVRARRRRPCPSSPTSASRRARRARTWASSPAPESGEHRRVPHLGELARACIWQSLPAPALGRFRHSQACWLLPWPSSPWPSSPVPALG
jgi:hypothetical protein